MSYSPKHPTTAHTCKSAHVLPVWDGVGYFHIYSKNLPQSTSGVINIECLLRTVNTFRQL